MKPTNMNRIPHDELMKRHLLDRKSGRKHGKRHATSKRKSRYARKKAAQAKRKQQANNLRYQTYTAEVRKFYTGERDTYPQLPFI